MDWPAALAVHPRFGGLLEIAVRHEQPTDRATFRRQLGTHSAINALEPGRREELIDQALEVAEAAGRIRRRRQRRDPLALRAVRAASGPSARGIARLHCACHGNCIAHKAIRSS